MGAFEDFVNANLGVRMPLFIDTTTPSLSSKAAGSLGSKFVDSTTNFLYEKTGYTNADWVKIAELGDSRGGGGGSIDISGGYNITVDEVGSTYTVNLRDPVTGTFRVQDSEIIGTGSGIPFAVSESGQVGLNLFTGENQVTGFVTPYHLHVSGVTALSGSSNLTGGSSPALTVVGNTELEAVTISDSLAVDNTLGSPGSFYVQTGVYLPNLTTAQRDGLDLYRDGSGALIFNSDSEQLQVHDGTTWRTLSGGALGSGVAVVANIGAGSGIASGVTGDVASFKSLIGGTNLQILGDATSLTLNVTGISGGSATGITGATNLGAGSGLISGITNNDLQVKSLVGGTNLQITGDGESLYLNVTGISGADGSGVSSFTGLSDTPSSFEANQFLRVSSDATGLIYNDLSGVISSQEIAWNVYSTTSDLPNATDHHGMFAHVHAEDAAYMAHAGNWVKIYPLVTGAEGLGDGSGVFKEISSYNLQFKSLLGGDNVRITGDGSTLTFDVTGISGGSTTGITGASNIGSGSGVFSGISDNDLVFRTIQAGPNVTIDEVGSGLRITASTTNVTVTGGTVSGGLGNNPYITGESNFYAFLPDHIILENPSAGPVVYALNWISPTHIFYWNQAYNDVSNVRFDNDSIGSNPIFQGTSYSALDTLSGLLASGRGVYLGGGGSGSSSSTTGITGVESLGAGSALASGVSGSDLYLKSLVGGTNVTLSSDDNTITINASAGGGGGSSTSSGFASWSGISDFSNLYTQLPEYLYVERANGYAVARLEIARSSDFQYTLNPTADKWLSFSNDAEGTYSNGDYTYNGTSQTWAAGAAGGGGTGPSLSGLITAGQVFYNGGGGSSTTGITGATNLGAGSGLISGITDNDLQLKSLVGGTNLQITGDGESLYLNVTGVSGSTVSGITGASNIGSGSGVFSGISDNDLVFRTIQAGPNVTIDEVGSGLRITASTTNVTVTGGSVSGGLGSNPFVTGSSNFYTLLPDSIVMTGAAGFGYGNLSTAFHLEWVDANDIYYIQQDSTSTPKLIRFNNDNTATFNSYINTSSTNYGPGKSLSGYIAEGKGVYLGGGGSGSSSSTTGITGATNLGAGSGLISGISDNDLQVKSLVGGTNLQITGDGESLYLNVTGISAGGGGGGGAGSGAGNGPGKSSYYTGVSNFYSDLPDWVAVKGAQSDPIYILYLSAFDGGTEFRYGFTADSAATYYFYSFGNDAAGTFSSSSRWAGVAVTAESPSLSGLLASGRAGYMGGGSGSSSSSCSGILNYRGAFAEGTDYEVNDFVTYNGKSYIATAATNGFDPSGYKGAIYVDDGDSTDGWLARSPSTVSVQTLNGNDTLKAAGTAATTIYVGRNLDLSGYTGSWTDNTGDYIVHADVLASTATPHLIFTYHPNSNDVSSFWSTNVGADNPPSGIVLGDDYSGSGPAAGVVGQITGRIAPTGTGLYIGLRTRDDTANTYANFDNIVIAEDIASTNPWSLLAGEIAVNNCGSGSSTTGITGATNLGAGSGLISGITDNDLQVKSLVGGTNLQITGDGESLYLNVTGVSGSTVSGITGASNIGSGSGVFSGISDNDLVFRTIEAGPNVSITESFSGLKISASTTNVTVTGGTVSGGLGSNPFVTGQSAFYTLLPDEIVLNAQAPYPDGAVCFRLHYISSTIYYIQLGNQKAIIFNNDNAGSFSSYSNTSAAEWGAGQSISGYIADGRAVYLGAGGSGSSSSTTGITGATNLGAGSGLISGITDNDLQVKSLVGGTNLQITGDGESLYLNVTGVSGSTVSGITGVESLGAGSALASGVSGSDLYLKSLVGGTNVTLSSDDNTITINASAGGGGGGGGSSSGSAFSNNARTSGWSNFYTIVPDALVLEDNGGNTGIFTVNQLLYSENEFYYESRYELTGPAHKFISFKNTSSGELGTYNQGVSTSVSSLSGLIDDDRAMYYAAGGGGGGGGGGTGSSMGGNQYINNESSFSEVLPDAIISPNDNGSEHTFVLSSVSSGSSSSFVDGDLSQGLTHWTGGSQYDRSDHAIPTINQGGLYGNSTTSKTAWGQTIDTTPGVTYTVGWNVTYLSSAAGWYRVYAGNSADFESDTIIYNSAGSTGPLTATFTAAQTQTNISWYASGPNINVAASGMYIDGAPTPKIIYSDPDHGSLEFTNDSSGAAHSMPSDYPELSLSGYIASGRAAYFGGGGSGSSSSTTGITGATNLGAGSGLISGISDNDLQVKSLVGGTNLQITGDGESLYLNVTGVSGSTVSGITGASNIGTGSGVFSGISDNDLVFRTIEGGSNVSIVESSSGLRINASTINVTVTGGSVSGGLGSNPFITGKSNYYSELPDQLVLTWIGGPYPQVFNLYQVETSWIYYEYQDGRKVRFTNNDEGSFSSWIGSNNYVAQSISGYVASGRGVYLGGGGSGSSSSTTGITGASNIGTGSGVFSGISDNELVFRTLEAGPNVFINTGVDGSLSISASTTNVTVTGGSVSGGIGSNPYITGKSNFYTELPDEILINRTFGDQIYKFELNNVSSSFNQIYYTINSLVSSDAVYTYRVTNNAEGTYEGFFPSNPGFSPTISLSGMIESGRAVYLGGGGSGSSTSTTGITGATNLGAGSGLISGITDNDLQVKSLVGGTNLQITGDGESLYLNVTGVSGSTVSGITGVESLGAGSALASGVSGSDLYLKSLVGGTNVTLSSDDNTITINAAGGGGGGGGSASGECSRAVIHLQSDIEEDFTTGIYDKSIQNNTVTINGVTNSTTQVHRGNSSIYFDGTSTNHLLVPENYPIYESTNATIESWIYWDPTDNDGVLAAHITSNPPSDGNYLINFSNNDSTFNIIFGGNNAYNFSIPSIGIPTQEWFHLAFCNYSGVQTLYINGSGNSMPAAAAAGNWGSAGSVYIGNYNTNSVYDFEGYLQDFRITRGQCVYTGDFTPPTALLSTACGGGSSSDSDCTGCGIPVSSTFTGRIPRAIIADYYFNGGAAKYKIQMPFFALGYDGDTHFYFEHYNEAWQNSAGVRLVFKFNDDAEGSVDAVNPSAGTYYFPDTTRTLSDYIASGDVIY